MRYQIGDVFDRLTIKAIIKHTKNPRALCLCSCGVFVTPQLGALGNGRAKSCGCLRREKLALAGVTHGMSGSVEYKTYQNILDRCGNPKCRSYKNYGGRGIRCLYKSFEEFFADVGRRPSGTWIERNGNNGHYQAGNCSWKSPSDNQKNKRVSKTWFISGLVFESSTEAAEFFGVDVSNVNRWCNGFTKNGKYFPPKADCSCNFKYE